MDPRVKPSLIRLSEDARDYHLTPRVPEIDHITCTEFLRQYVGPNQPVLIKHAIDHWPARNRWTSDYLKSQMQDRAIGVALTPDGYADAPKDGLFVMPHEQDMIMADFLDALDHPQDGIIHYIQRQNSNLTREFEPLRQDVLELDWASAAFESDPDAINFWMGDERAVTSTHKDPYDNIYCVVQGHKDIILHPPCDLPWMDYRLYQPAIHVKTRSGFTVQSLTHTPPIPWIAVDPLDLRTQSEDYRQLAHPMHVRVEAGDALYLPSLWFHHLRQSHGCMAVNFWYDMKFDAKFTYFNLLQNLCFPDVFQLESDTST
ncbi:hypothetical protein TCAL_00513 [Tigriopus californicus]|uniref:JmjC domain-containing protein n=1 Tax=Tigriopus californicus TaxID=6832 RepID=A0A553PB91_TIGCA|nr:bifunctional peptidase and (3S)-lysyl hydroxylase Jmjd7-like [Tigriopus californicus]TRY74909.1 hypothetical protein TCAL_00513 [Tigriopus californicus]|eukprot:TCALIF_00513-PA protein Name:"Similar to Jmjd7 JmjC domain-containing protein 7 (Mus musculus)" AED:0.03 eAED:0.03 QI:513/1/1/1/0.33/0.25/4/59/315